MPRAWEDAAHHLSCFVISSWKYETLRLWCCHFKAITSPSEHIF